MSRLLENKVVLVTGASSGIGRACALTFAREGGKVVVADIVVEGGEETVRMIKKSGGEAIFVKTNVTSAVEVQAMVKKAIDTYGRLDCAHNNAARGSEQEFLADTEEKVFDDIININLKSVWLCMKYEIQQMLKQGKGSIVNTASIGGLVGLDKRSVYTASKHGVIGLTQSAALEYATRGIRINAVCPSIISTPMIERMFAKLPEKKAESLIHEPMGRLGTPEEVAEAVVWLLSDAASFVTGHPLPVDGAWLAQ